MKDRTLLGRSKLRRSVTAAIAIWATGAFVGWALIALLAYGLAP